MNKFRLTMVLLILLFSVGMMSGCIQISVDGSGEKQAEKDTSGSAPGCVWPWCSNMGGSGGGIPAFIPVVGTIEDIKKNVVVYVVKDSDGNTWRLPALSDTTQVGEQLEKNMEVTMEKKGAKLVIKKN